MPLLIKLPQNVRSGVKWVSVFKNGLNKICGRQPLKHLKRYGMF